MNFLDYLRSLAPGPVLARTQFGGQSIAFRRWTTPAEDAEADAFWLTFEGRADQLAEEKRLNARDRWQHYAADPATVAAFEKATDHGAQPCRVHVNGEGVTAERLNLGGLPGALAKARQALPNRFRVMSAAEFCGVPVQEWLAT